MTDTNKTAQQLIKPEALDNLFIQVNKQLLEMMELELNEEHTSTIEFYEDLPSEHDNSSKLDDLIYQAILKLEVWLRETYETPLHMAVDFVKGNGVPGFYPAPEAGQSFSEYLSILYSPALFHQPEEQWMYGYKLASCMVGDGVGIWEELPGCPCLHTIV